MTIDRFKKDVWPPVALLALIGLVWALVGATGDVIITRVLIVALISMVWVVGLYTFSGLSGTISFGHLAFAAFGAYACAYLTIPVALKTTLFSQMPGALHFLVTVQTGFPVALLISGLVAAVVSVIVSPAIVRLSKLQGSIATLALLIIVYTVFNNWTAVTRGQSTMIGVPADLSLAAAALLAMGAAVIAWLLTISRVGIRLRASHDDDVAAQAIGIGLARERRIALAVSAFLTGVGGAMYAHFIITFNPDQFYLQATFVSVAMLVIGGLRSVSGAVIGTLVYATLAEVLRRIQSGDIGGVQLPSGTAECLLAALLLVVIIKRPMGITGGREIPWPSRLGRPGAIARPVASGPGLSGVRRGDDVA